MPALVNCCSRSAGTGSVKVRLNCISAGQSILTASEQTPLPFIWRVRSITSVAPTSTFFGSQPRSAHVPPNGRESTIATFQSAERHSNAGLAPPAPVPMTMRSNFFVIPQNHVVALCPTLAKKNGNATTRVASGRRPDFRNNKLILSEWVGMVLIRNCKRHSSDRSSALISHHTPDNRRNLGTRLPAFFLRSDVHIAGK